MHLRGAPRSTFQLQKAMLVSHQATVASNMTCTLAHWRMQCHTSTNLTRTVWNTKNAFKKAEKTILAMDGLDPSYLFLLAEEYLRNSLDLKFMQVQMVSKTNLILMSSLLLLLIIKSSK